MHLPGEPPEKMPDPRNLGSWTNPCGFGSAERLGDSAAGWLRVQWMGYRLGSCEPGKPGTQSREA